MDYIQAVEYLHGTNRAFCKPGTQRVEALCREAGDPQKALSVIHVAGTNGKGSFCVLLASLLTAAGFRVGRFSSPALCRINECVTVNGEDIPDGDFARLVSSLAPAADGMEDRPTEFEILTVLAFSYFREKGCDYVIVECGMGGLTDATNVFDAPLLSVITGISVDHASFLGGTEAEIAEQKAGIIKKNRPVLWCGTDPRAEAVIRRRAQSLSAPLHTVPRETLHLRKINLSQTLFDFGGRTGLTLSMLGTYQLNNAANALTALDILGIVPLDSQLRRGLREARLPGRFELLSRDPVIIADGGHNPEGVDRAVESVEFYFRGQKVVFVSGIMADKDYSFAARRMGSVAEAVYTVTPENPRSLPAEEYAAVFRNLGISATPCDTVEQALGQALSHGLPVICLGSLYQYRAIVSALEEISGK